MVKIEEQQNGTVHVYSDKGLKIKDTVSGQVHSEYYLVGVTDITKYVEVESKEAI